MKGAPYFQPDKQRALPDVQKVLILKAPSKAIGTSGWYMLYALVDLYNFTDPHTLRNNPHLYRTPPPPLPASCCAQSTLGVQSTRECRLLGILQLTYFFRPIGTLEGCRPYVHPLLT